MANKNTDLERQQRLWCWYDFATNGYQITTVTALLPHFFSKAVMGKQTVSIFGYTIDANSLWSYGLGIAALVVFLMAPVLGAIADRTMSKRKFLIFFACGGIFFSSLLWFAQPGAVWFTWICFILAHICYTSGNVFYDSFLPHLTHDHVGLDKLSARGFAYGYLGSGIQFALVLGLLSFNESLGISTEIAVRLSLLSAGLWWLIFSLPTLLHLREPEISSDYRKLSVLGNIQDSLRQNLRFLQILSRHAPILVFLIAFFLYNDGIQTVISISSLYATVELQLKDNTIMTTFLIVQFVAWFGALLFGRISQKIGTKRALMVALLVWMFVLWFGYRIPVGEANHFIILGLMVGLVLGGSQSLSRSLYASMMPIRFSAQCFGMYSVFNKLSSIMGPFLYGYISMVTGSARPAILALLIFFVGGLILLWVLNETKARAAQSRLAEELQG